MEQGAGSMEPDVPILNELEEESRMILAFRRNLKF